MRTVTASVVGRVAACLVFASCTRTVVVGVAPDVETSVLVAARQGWPDDTTGGVSAVGTAKRVDSSSTPEQLKARAEYSALLRLLGTLRNSEGLSPELTETQFVSCVEENASNVCVKRESLPRGAVQVGLFVGKEHVQALVSCLRRY